MRKMREEEGVGKRCTKGWKAHRVSKGGRRRGGGMRPSTAPVTALCHSFPSSIHLFCHTAEGGRREMAGRGARGLGCLKILPSFLCPSPAVSVATGPPSSYWAYSFGRHEWEGESEGGVSVGRLSPALQARKINTNNVFLLLLLLFACFKVRDVLCFVWFYCNKRCSRMEGALAGLCTTEKFVIRV